MACGLEASRGDTRHASDFYYAPQELNVARAEANLARQWTARFKSHLFADYTQLPDYQSGRFDFALDYRF